MKDRQVEPASGKSRIPVVSALLHCVSMTTLVYLRSSFGFVYLRPRSIFFTFSWAFLLFTIYAWIEPGVWREYRAVCLFGLGAVALYWVHLPTAFLRELYHRGEHDHYSGRSHSLRLLRWTGREPTPLSEMRLHLWAEPGAVLFAALVLRAVMGERHLSPGLVSPPGVYGQRKRSTIGTTSVSASGRDIFIDAGDTVEPTAPNNAPPEPPKAARKARLKRQRNTE